jgi:hypothetical protein
VLLFHRSLIIWTAPGDPDLVELHTCRYKPLFQTWIWPILGWIFLPWTTLMYMAVAGGGIIGFDWILLGLGVFADMASYFGSYAERRRIPYGDRFPTY